MLGLGLSLPLVARSRVGLAPSLDLSFMSGALDSRVSFSRASLAWQTDVSGNIVTAPHNLLTDSQSFDAAAWTKATLTVTANAAVSPDGTTTADKLVTAATTSGQFISQAFAFAASVSYCFSVYAKAAGFSYLRLSFPNPPMAAGRQATFDLSLGTMTDKDAGLAAATITAVGNGWYRCAIIGTATSATSGNCSLTINGANTAGIVNVVGDGSGGILAWGAQLEQHGSARDYINTSVKNLLGFSEQFDNAAWTKGAASVVANSVSGPEGTQSADTLTDDATNADHVITSPAIAWAGNAQYTFSVYAKAGTRNLLRLTFNTGSNWVNGSRLCYFDLTNGTVIGAPAAPATAIIQAMGNGWYRCAITATSVAAPASSGVHVVIANTSSSTTYLGNGTGTIHLFGAQLSSSASLDAYSVNAGAAPASAAYHGPRFDYDPVTKEAKGLLIEESRTNLLLRSADLSNAVWGAGGGGLATVSSAGVVAPDGGAANTLTDANGAAILGLSQSLTVISGTATYTASVYVKAGTSSVVSLRALLSGGATVVPGEVVVNLATGAAQWRTSQVGTSFSVTPVAAGWYRVSVTVTDNASGNNAVSLELRPAFATSYSPTLDTAATGTAHFWGAQIEAGTFPTSFIPTAAATVTRAADVATMPTGAWFNAAAGTLMVETRPTATAEAAAGVGFDAAGNANDSIDFYGRVSGGQYRARIRVGGVTETDLQAGNIASGTAKIALAYAVNDIGFCVDGGAVATDTTAALPTVTRLSVSGKAQWLRRVRYWNVRRPNADLQSLTT